MRKVLLVAVPLLLVVPLSAQLRIESTLTKHAHDLAAAFNEKDSAKVASFYTDDATLMPPNEPAVKGRQNIQAWFKGGIDQGLTDLKLTPTESSIRGDQAFEAGTYSIVVKAGAGQGATGKGSAVDSGKYVVVLKRVGGEWKIAYDIFNSNLPVPPQDDK